MAITKIKCPECGLIKYVRRSFIAGKRVCIKCNIRYSIDYKGPIERIKPMKGSNES